MSFIPQENILHILSFLDKGKDHINFTNSIKHTRLRLEYHKYTFRTLLNFNFEKEIETINTIFIIKYFKQILERKNNSLILDLSCTNITDVSKLGKAHTLILYRTNITDVSNLGNVYNLDLSFCVNITDISKLSNIHKLDLSNTNISDVSNLGKVHTLNLSYCDNITDISMLRNVHNLILRGCKNI